MNELEKSKLEELRGMVKPGKCPLPAVLRKIELFLMEQQREILRQEKRLVDLDDLTLDLLIELGLSECVAVSFKNMPGFLVNPDKIIRVWLDKDKTNFTTYLKDESDGRDFLEFAIKDEDGEYYSLDNVHTYYFEKNGRAVSERALAWRKPPTTTCVQCSREYVNSLIVHNHRVNGKVDKWCASQINQYEHPRQDPAAPISAYHSHRGNWIFYPVAKADERSIPMGVEIEMHSKYGNDISGAQKAARNILMATLEDYPNYYFETDGSLAEGGFEMITNPMTLEFGSEWWGRMLPLLRKHCVGYGVEKLLHGPTHDGGASIHSVMNYGIHITVSRRNVPDIVIPKLQRFLDDRHNAEFIHAIAQRSVIYGGYYLGSKDKPQAKAVLPWIGKDIKTIKTIERRCPINIKGVQRGDTGLIEFRMFRSTLNQVSFLKNLEFIDAITSYYKERLGMNVDHRAFIGYVLDNRRRYPNLIEYLKHPLYFVKGCGVVKNTWRALVDGVVVKKFDPLNEYGPALNANDPNDLLETPVAA